MELKKNFSQINCTVGFTRFNDYITDTDEVNWSKFCVHYISHGFVLSNGSFARKVDGNDSVAPVLKGEKKFVRHRDEIK